MFHLEILIIELYVLMISQFQLEVLKPCSIYKVCVLRKLAMKLISIWLLILMVQTMPSSLNNPTKYGQQLFLNKVQVRLWDFDESNPFLDFTSEVYCSNSFWLMGLAFHPNFANNGRFFASYTCNKVKTPGCFGRCLCYRYLNCDPSQRRAFNAIFRFF